VAAARGGGGVAWLGAAAIAACVLACGDDRAVDVPAGGALTVFDRSSNAFSLPAPGLAGTDFDRHVQGDAAFDQTFVTGDAPVGGGLGPLFNNTSCVACHNRDGRGLAAISPDRASSVALVRVSLPDGEPGAPGGPVPLPEVGTQLQDHAVFGQQPEARIELTWALLDGAYADGEPFQLRLPGLDVELAGGAPLPPGTMTSLRQPPAVFGLGLLEAIPDDALLAAADPDDADGDGISGRVNQVWDGLAQQTRIGRFGAKANTASVREQVAGAYFHDMGITTPLVPGDDGAAPDLPGDDVEATAFYVATLGVPARLALSPEAARGELLFEQMGCASCHTPVQYSGDHELALLRDQTFAPYTDLLLHDMGDALADGRPDFEADGREWRTPPLWGLGLVQTVLPGAGYLHDGRARTPAEAILWHGGEADAAAEHFRTASAAERAALLAFLAAL
jgi:CxxC motif-containing protein (DUF1111 family)